MALRLHNKHKQHLCYLYQKIIVLMIFCSFFILKSESRKMKYKQCCVIVNLGWYSLYSDCTGCCWYRDLKFRKKSECMC